jgi:hypothetical protein
MSSSRDREHRSTQVAKRTKTEYRRGPRTLYPNKVRMPVSVQLTADLHAKLDAILKRFADDGVAVRKGDVFCKLLDRYGDDLQLTADEKRLLSEAA